MTKQELLKISAIQSLVNAAISGVQAYYAMRSQDAIALTLDTISGGSGSVMGKSVSAACIMGFAVTLVTYLTFRKKLAKNPLPGARLERLRFCPDYVLLAAKNAVFVFGLLVVAGVLWQFWIGSLKVASILAILITMMIAAGVTAYSSFSAMVSMQERTVLP